jgi:hypothetical protein
MGRARIEAYQKAKGLVAGCSFLAETRREEIRAKAVCDCIEDLIWKENEMSTSDPGAGWFGNIIATVLGWFEKKPDPPPPPPATKEKA